jgi:PAS domain S-box-containing protein
LLYYMLLAGASLVTAASAGVIYAQSPDRRASQLFALLMLGAAWWSACELGWNLADDVASARTWMRVGSGGWLLLGAIVPHLVYHSLIQSAPVAFAPWRRLQSVVIVAGYASFAVTLLLSWTTAFVIGPVFRGPFGWTFEPGLGQHLSLGFALLCAAISCHALARSMSRSSGAETLQMPFVWMSIAGPVIAIVTTEFAAPLLQLPVPHLGSASFAVTGALVVWTVKHYGLSMITPPEFGDQMLETLQDGVAFVNVDGSIRRANDALARISGYEADSLAGLELGNLIDRDFSKPTELQDLRRELHRKDGETIPISVAVSVLRERRKNELGYVVVIRDMRELEHLRRSSVTNARLAAVGELAAGLAHEINNPIAFVSSNLRMLREYWEQMASRADGADGAEPDGIVGEGHELIDESLEGVERAAEIIRGVKNFAHTSNAETRRAGLNDVVAESVRMTRPRVTAGVHVECRFDPLPEIVCSPQSLEQVFLNLLGNAIHAVDGSGLIRVSTEQDGDFVVASVSDDGHGIPTEKMDRIFDPFFTTKPVGEGTGLGLGIAHHIVSQHGGSIAVESRAGEGATFRVRLPIEPVC